MAYNSPPMFPECTHRHTSSHQTTHPPRHSPSTSPLTTHPGTHPPPSPLTTHHPHSPSTIPNHPGTHPPPAPLTNHHPHSPSTIPTHHPPSNLHAILRVGKLLDGDADSALEHKWLLYPDYGGGAVRLAQAAPCLALSRLSIQLRRPSGLRMRVELGPLFEFWFVSRAQCGPYLILGL